MVANEATGIVRTRSDILYFYLVCDRHFPSLYTCYFFTAFFLSPSLFLFSLFLAEVKKVDKVPIDNGRVFTFPPVSLMGAIGDLPYSFLGQCKVKTILEMKHVFSTNLCFVNQ